MTERERKIHFLKSGFVCYTRVARFTSCFSIVRTHHISPLHSVNGILPFQSNLIGIFFHLSLPRHIRSPMPSPSCHFKIQSSSQNITIISSQTCSYHRTPIALASPSKVFFKPSKLISSWLFSHSS